MNGIDYLNVLFRVSFSSHALVIIRKLLLILDGTFSHMLVNEQSPHIPWKMDAQMSHACHRIHENQ